MDFDFSHYFTYAEIVAFLERYQAQYPNLIALETIGKSYEGRDIWLATLTNQNTGDAIAKPGYWLDANTHAGEVTGSAVVLYILHYLLTTYGEDAQSVRLLDGYTVYILPRITVDGSEKYLTTPYLLRSSPRPYPHPEPKDGLYQEDINGDGLILDMRVKDPCGAWKKCEEDPRAMVRREPEEFGGEYYTVFSEGLIRNYDGYEIPAAPRFEGLDFNRNYPFQWQTESEQRGAGDFPYSEPETRAEAEFWRSHNNINSFITYHTYSAVILRPYSTHADDHFPTADLDLYQFVGDKGKEITGYECVSVYHDFRYDPKSFTTGSMDDHGYDNFGWLGFTVELWDAATAAGIEKNGYVEWFRWHPPSDEVKLLQWSDEELDGKGFIDWQPFEHPQLGPVEIGGWDFKNVWQNAPEKYLPELCEKQAKFAIAHALMSPKLAFSRVECVAVSGDVYRIFVQIENQGFLPTYSTEKALERKQVEPIRAVIELPLGCSLVTGKAEQTLGQLAGRSNKYTRARASEIDYRRKVEWVIQGVAGSEVELRILSDRAGHLATSIELNPDSVI
ncbi:MAG: M14 family metallopeptidase [Cyanobacteria bacterium P01_H01_bin.15]